MKVAKYAALWVALIGLASLLTKLDCVDGDTGMLLAMGYGASASYATFGIYAWRETR